MSSFPVFADVSSRLHADIAIVRLIRAGIRPERISAIFPRRSAPNSVCCWLTDFHRIPISSALPLAAAGIFGQLWKRGIHSAAVERKLETLGLDPEIANRFLEKTEGGQIVICVHARSETEAVTAGRIFQRAGAENICCAAEEIAWTRETLAPKWAPLAA